MELERKKLQGVLNILSFNRHFYVIGFSVLLLITASWLLFNWSNLLFNIIVIAFLYGLLMPLIVSAYIYDISGYYNFEWLKDHILFDLSIKNIININAGFDETSFILKNYFPKSHLRVFDFYNPKQHTEPAIIRARKVSLVYPKTQQIKTNIIPLDDNSIDIVFLLSTAHEIRTHKERVEFLKECKRVCKPNGRIVMVEHLRDLPNFLAFSVGFTHFFSKKTWEKAYLEAGFSSITETKFTPFMSIFNCHI